VLENRYTASPKGSLDVYSEPNRQALTALAGSAVVSIWLAPSGAYGIVPNIDGNG
jgi:hypothetical protein